MAIIGLDSLLDFAHFYHYFEREIARNFSPVGVGEAKWLSKQLGLLIYFVRPKAT
jgi:hypothetical protein|tara:strand:+ start:1481 stop:1645 length:165 start_codon:yes stop_codon:yes gene_type:complete